MSIRKLAVSTRALQIVLGATATAAGADKFFNQLTDWEQYLSPAARRHLPVSSRQFMRLAGVVEMGVGIAILRGHTRAGGFAAAAWLLGIAINLVAGGKYLDVAARDVNMAIEGFALATLSGIRPAASRAGSLSLDQPAA